MFKLARNNKINIIKLLADRNEVIIWQEGNTIFSKVLYSLEPKNLTSNIIKITSNFIKSAKKTSNHEFPYYIITTDGYTDTLIFLSREGEYTHEMIVDGDLIDAYFNDMEELVLMVLNENVLKFVKPSLGVVGTIENVEHPYVLDLFMKKILCWKWDSILYSIILNPSLTNASDDPNEWTGGIDSTGVVYPDIEHIDFIQAAQISGATDGFPAIVIIANSGFIKDRLYMFYYDLNNTFIKMQILENELYNGDIKIQPLEKGFLLFLEQDEKVYYQYFNIQGKCNDATLIENVKMIDTDSYLNLNKVFILKCNNGLEMDVMEFKSN